MSHPTTQQVNQWKAEYGDVFSVEVKTQLFVFRALTFKELYQLTRSASTSSFVDLEDYIVEQALLYPSIQIAESLPAGAYSSLAESIRDASGLGDAKTAISTLEQARVEANNVINVAKVYILTTMPAYKEEDIEDYTATQLFHKVALAEKIIELQQQVMGGNELTFTIIDPEEESKKAAEEERKQKERLDRFAKQGGHFNKDSAPPLRPKIKTDDPIAAKLRGRR